MFLLDLKDSLIAILFLCHKRTHARHIIQTPTFNAFVNDISYMLCNNTRQSITTPFQAICHTSGTISHTMKDNSLSALKTTN